MKSLALLLLLVTSATAEPIVPPQYRGAWCSTAWQTIYRRCRDKNDESHSMAFMIDRDGVGSEDSFCKITAFRKSNNGEHRVALECQKVDPTDKDRVTRSVERWRLGTNGTRLQILRPEIEL
jgi:hypothetical protein